MRSTKIEILENIARRGPLEDEIIWKYDALPPTKFWYDFDDDLIHTDFGITLPFVYDLRIQWEILVWDVTKEAKEYYQKQGIILYKDDD